MYWQVYLHKTVLGAEMMLVKIIHRAKELITKGIPCAGATPTLDFFLQAESVINMEEHLDAFCMLDDYDIMATIKNWCIHPDKILSLLCRSLIERRLFKVKLQAEPVPESFVADQISYTEKKLAISGDDVNYFVFTGEASNTTYDLTDENITILFKDGSTKDISKVDNALVSRNLSSTVKKHYICYLR